MVEEKEWLDVVKEINVFKDIIKDSSQKITVYLDDPAFFSKIDHEFLEIVNALGKIGIISSRSKDVGSYTEHWSSYFALIQNQPGQLGSPLGNGLIKDALRRVCMLSVHVEKKGKYFEIKIPNLNLLKIG